MADEIAVAEVPTVHIRFEGQSFDIPMSELDIGNQSTDEQVKNAVAEHQGAPRAKLNNYVVDRNAETGSMTLRPAAVFG
jgi:hypothetical protein